MSLNQPGVASMYTSSHLTHRYQIGPPDFQSSEDKSTSLDISQRIERKIAQYNTSQNVLKRWLFETISLGTAAIAMVSYAMKWSTIFFDADQMF